MKVYINPDKKDWSAIITRPVIDVLSLQDKVKSILNDVKENGDEAVRKYTLQFDGSVSKELKASEEEITKAKALLSAALIKAIQTAADNIRSFHEKQIQ